ncbi:MAG: AEC family transporter [Hyphomicrobiales bacterium]|nr:AEC family transporter [Hyphomicrobiales bacterium]
MLEILNNILPVFIIIGIGYGAVKSGYLKPGLADNLNALAVRLAVPILLFNAMYNLDFASAFAWPLLVSFYIGAIASFFLTVILARAIFKRRPGEAVAVGFCATFSNTVLLGIPIAERVLGPEIMPLVFGIIALHAPSLYAIGIITMEFAKRDGRGFGRTLSVAGRSIFANPLMVGISGGALLNMLSISLPVPLVASIEMVAKAAIPLALIGIGGALTNYQLKSRLSETVTVSVISLLVHPAIVFVVSYYVLGLQLQYVQVAVIIAAMPPGLNIYIFAVMYDRAVALSASTIIVATMASILTISTWFWIFSWF